MYERYQTKRQPKAKGKNLLPKDLFPGTFRNKSPYNYLHSFELLWKVRSRGAAVAAAAYFLPQQAESLTFT